MAPGLRGDCANICTAFQTVRSLIEFDTVCSLIFFLGQEMTSMLPGKKRAGSPSGVYSAAIHRVPYTCLSLSSVQERCSCHDGVGQGPKGQDMCECKVECDTAQRASVCGMANLLGHR